MAQQSPIDWESEEMLRAILTDAKVSAKAPRDAIERAHDLMIKENNEKYPHLKWSWYRDTNYRIHIRATKREPGE